MYLEYAEAASFISYGSQAHSLEQKFPRIFFSTLEVLGTAKSGYRKFLEKFTIFSHKGAFTNYVYKI